MLRKEDDEFIRLAPPEVSAVLKAYCVKRVAFMREVVHICSPDDYAAVSMLVMGLPMLGWSCPAFGLMSRVNHPIQSVEDFMSSRTSRNSRIVEKIGPSGDKVLDKLAYDKTLAEIEAGVTFGPYFSIDSIPFSDPCIAPRQGIWEEHGDALSPTVRIIDDLLCGEQNSTTGTCQAHRPTDVDGLVSQTRAVAESCNGELSAWTSDFAKAFKQVPADPSQRKYLILAQYSPSAEQVVYFVTNCQVFGSKSSPLNFSRYPALFCWCAAVLFKVAATHCVDDVISVESSDTAASGMEAWENFMALCGWKLSSEKRKLASNILTVIGVSLNLQPLPSNCATVMVTKKRLQALWKILRKIMSSGRLGSGLAASLTGKLGFTLSSCFGRVGRCHLRPSIKRAYSRKQKLDHMLYVCIGWWLAFLQSYQPRPVPTSLSELPLIVSYSDGEGGLAGIGAAVWRRKGPPQALYCEVPAYLRDYWHSSSSSLVYTDIFLVEALGPLLLLLEFPKIFKNSMWLHFIDNEAAEASLIRGTSSKSHGDHIVGLTWSLIQKLGIFAYFDRVCSKSNPVDGLSRRKFVGPWDKVFKPEFPALQLSQFAESCGDETWGGHMEVSARFSP